MLTSEKYKWKSTLFWVEKIQIITLFGFILGNIMLYETLEEVAFGILHPYCFQDTFTSRYIALLMLNILIGGVVSIWISIISYKKNTLKYKSRFMLLSPVLQSMILILISFLFQYSGLGFELFYGNKTYEYVYYFFAKISPF